MQTWIFQGNPDDYDIDGYLASRPTQVIWLVTRHAAEMAVGDRVYLWRNQGKQRALGGIVAECVITVRPELRGEDPDGIQFWRDEGPRANAQLVRTAMRLVKVATKREVIRRDWCDEDPVLRDLPNLRMQAGTNYRVSPEQARRLSALWGRTGRDWNRSESIGGLLAYAQTYGQPVSQLPASPVANIALTIGRAVSGVYAKVMNFRSLDPRAPGKGMSGAGEADRGVWQEFFDGNPSELRIDALSKEFARLWGDAQLDQSRPPEASETASIITDEAERLEGLTLEQLQSRCAQRETLKLDRPGIRILSAKVFDRDPLIIALAKKRAANKCEVPDCTHPSFETAQGTRYTEVHHIVPLADGGEDRAENVACLCPAHHREVHLGVRGQEINTQLLSLRTHS